MEYLVKADLPEMKKDDVKVTVENGILIVSGERKAEREEKKKKFHRIERSFGSFQRTFTFPEDADAAKIAAEFKDGVLKVHLPKSPTAKPKTDFIELLRRRPELALRMLGSMSQHLRVLVGLLDDLTLKDMETRLTN
jgi:HSP20 family molecular chaperone IbpA